MSFQPSTKSRALCPACETMRPIVVAGELLKLELEPHDRDGKPCPGSSARVISAAKVLFAPEMRAT